MFSAILGTPHAECSARNVRISADSRNGPTQKIALSSELPQNSTSLLYFCSLMTSYICGLCFSDTSRPTSYTPEFLIFMTESGRLETLGSLSARPQETTCPVVAGDRGA